MDSKMTSLRSRIRAGKTCLGLSVVMPWPSTLEMAAAAGYDFVRIDCEHALMNPGELRNMLSTARLLGLPCHVRIPDMAMLTPLLGQEPSGIMVPHVDQAADARSIVEKCKFAPTGERGMDGNTRRMRCEGMSRAEYMEYIKESFDIVVQIESRRAIDNIDEILSVEGIDMVATGRADLSADFGVPGQKKHPQVIEAENYIISKALEHNRIPIVAVEDRERMNQLHEAGVRCFVIRKDEALLMKGMKESIKIFSV